MKIELYDWVLLKRNGPRTLVLVMRAGPEENKLHDYSGVFVDQNSKYPILRTDFDIDQVQANFGPTPDWDNLRNWISQALLGA